MSLWSYKAPYYEINVAGAESTGWIPGRQDLKFLSTLHTYDGVAWYNTDISA